LSISTTTTTTDDTKTTQQRHKDDTKTTRTAAAIESGDLHEPGRYHRADRSVVVELTGHYERTGVKFRLFKDQYEIAEAMKISVDELLRRCGHLREEGCIYFQARGPGLESGAHEEFCRAYAAFIM